MYEKENYRQGPDRRPQNYANINEPYQPRNYAQGSEPRPYRHREIYSPGKQENFSTDERFKNIELLGKYGLDRRAEADGHEAHYRNTNQELATQNRRENSRKQELEMRMNNINSINDKIYGLLNLVKKDRVYHSKEKEKPEEPPHRPMNQDPSQRSPHRSVNQELPRRPISRTPSTVNQALPSQPHYQSQQQQQLTQNEKLEPEEEFIPKAQNKSLQRIRALSTLEPNLGDRSSKQKFKNIYNRKQPNNEEDSNGKRQPSAQSPLPKPKQTTSRDNLGRYEAPYAPIQPKYSPSPTVEKMRSNGQITFKPINNPNREATPTRNDRGKDQGDRFQSYNRLQRQKQQPDPSRVSLENNYLPLTFVPNQRQQPHQESHYQKYSGLKVIEDQIKRIKEKMGDSFNPYNQRVTPNNNRKQTSTPDHESPGRPHSPANFELKVYPVKTDKPETLKIAEKLCFQIEIDSRMRKSREAFLRMEGEEKWRELSDRLSKNECRLTVPQLKRLLAAANQKTYQSRNEQPNVALFAEELADSQRFWEKHVMGCASLRALRREGFDGRTLDSSGVGFLKMEDVLRFVNEHTAHSYRSSDLGVIFGRLWLLEESDGLEGVRYDTFMRAFTM